MRVLKEKTDLVSLPLPIIGGKQKIVFILSIFVFLLIVAITHAYFILPHFIRYNASNPIPNPVVNVSQEFPDIIMQNGQFLGGLGRLIYDKAKEKYSVVDFVFTPYVVEGDTIRAMNPKEGGGAMAIPTAIRSFNGAVFAMIPSYSIILKLGSDFSILTQASYGVFQSVGSSLNMMEVSNGNIFFFKDRLLLAYDENLRKIGELDINNPPGFGLSNIDRFTVSANKLYFFGSSDTGPAVDCAMPPCGERYDVVIVADISDPRAMRLEKNEKVPDEDPPLDVRFKGIDPLKAEWLIVRGYGESQTIELRKIKNIARVVSSQKVPGEAMGLTDVAPFYLLINKNNALFLASVDTGADPIIIGDEIDIALPYRLSSGGVTMKSKGDQIFVSFGPYLRVINLKPVPRLALAQDFVDSYGQQFLIEYFDFGDGLASPKASANRERLTALLQSGYFSFDRARELQAQIDKLTALDAWAIPLLAATLKKGGSASVVHPIIAEALGNIGSEARVAIPAILDASMSAAAIRGDYTEPMVGALKKIDPEGHYIIPELPLFEQRHYKAGARHLSKKILLQLQGAAAQEALKQY